jgi:hypothetical protein
MNQPLPDGTSSLPSRRLEVLLAPPQVGETFIRHRCILRRIDGPEHVDATLWYELPAHLPQISPDDAEPFLIASIMDAMQENRSLHVGGKVSFQLLSNLQEFMVAWSRWLPDIFRVVELTADAVTTSPAPSDLAHDSAVTAHTGGIDASCTLYRHSRGRDGHRSRRITACAVVHGFLIALDQEEKFDRSFALAQSGLDSLGLVAYPVRTNYREVVRTHWNNVYGVAMVSLLQFLKPMGRSCLINAHKPYDDLVFPRGSNPITDAFLSSDSLQVLQDGSRFDRVEKTSIVAEWPEGTRHLRVCWKGGQIEAHCGKCEECIRTKLGFLAIGRPYPDSLGASPTTWEILALESLNSASRTDFQKILDHARRCGIKAPWVRALGFRLRFERFSSRLAHYRWRILRALGRS